MTVLAGRYELLERVGEGGMSVVWRAHDSKLERDVAVKLLRSFVAHEPEQRRRFEREARTLARLASDHIVRVYDYVDTGEQAFLVMEYVEGGNLAQTTFARLPLSVREAAAFTAPVAHALAYAHAKGVVHRDLTPANVLIERETGRVVTTDFGLARIARSAGSLTASGVLIGTPEYWSPEQAMGRDSDGAADVYALGCILFLLLSGKLPFEGDDRLAVGLRRAHEDAPSLEAVLRSAPAMAVTVVDSLLARDPAARLDAAAAAAALEKLAPDAHTAAELRAALPSRASLEPATVVVPPERPTVVTAAAPPTLPLVAARAAAPPSRPRLAWRRRVGVAVAAATAIVVGAVIVAGHVGRQLRHAPNVVTLQENAARARIRRLLPDASVTVARVYSVDVAPGRVIRQQPEPRALVGRNAQVRLVVSRGNPFAPVPSIGTGASTAAALASLRQSGFGGRVRYEPSWTVRKGTVIGFDPVAGTRLRRPATVRIVLASGYPRSVVPNVENKDLASAQSQLVATHLRYRIVYRLAQGVPTNQVLHEIPAAGTSVYQGTRVRLTVSRTLRWVKVFSSFGADAYESNAFSVPDRWRIRYRVSASGLAPALAQFTWGRDGDLFGDGSFVADKPGVLLTYVTSSGAGTYRLAVSPYAGTGWYVEVDAFK